MPKPSLIDFLFVPLFLLLVVYPLAALCGHLRLEGLADTFADSFFWRSVKNTMLAAFGASVLGVVLGLGFGYYHLFARRSVVYARTIVSGVDQIEPEIIAVARTLGDTPHKAYLRVVVPALSQALFFGFVLSFARSVSASPTLSATAD